jgi:NAD(P)H-dependent flavin oxidoreductase YrpB (nitropropane dioxygenase family)
MSGGPSTPALVIAAGEAGGLGFLAGGYKTPEQLAEQLTAVRRQGRPFGVNLFAPNPVPVDPRAFQTYAASLRADAARYGLELAGSTLVEDDDRWNDKLDLLLAQPVPVVSFTFGLPDKAVIASLRRAGSLVVQTVTSVAEARLAAAAGVDMLAVQGSAAGGHSGTLTPQQLPESIPLTELLGRVRAAVSLPLIAAGGLSTAGEVAEALDAGAVAAMVGTVLLRTDESGASAPYRAALADPTRGDTVVTRVFTGRPARALRNTFIELHDKDAPLGYPAIHYLTSPLRRAAAAAGDAEHINLWAGTGYRNARSSRTSEVLADLAASL